MNMKLVCKRPLDSHRQLLTVQSHLPPPLLPVHELVQPFFLSTHKTTLELADRDSHNWYANYLLKNEGK